MKRTLIILGAFILAGCASVGQNGDPLPKMTFDHIKAYPIYVASYETVEPDTANNSGNPAGFIANPGKIVLDYLNSRFESAGTQGKLIAKIASVDIIHKRVDSKNSFNALIGLNKKDHYRVTVVLDISAIGVNNIEWQKQSMTVYRDIYLSEHLSLVEREKLELEAMDHMIDDLDIALRKVLEEKFGIIKTS